MYVGSNYNKTLAAVSQIFIEVCYVNNDENYVITTTLCRKMCRIQW